MKQNWVLRVKNLFKKKIYINIFIYIRATHPGQFDDLCEVFKHGLDIALESHGVVTQLSLLALRQCPLTPLWHAGYHQRLEDDHTNPHFSNPAYLSRICQNRTVHIAKLWLKNNKDEILIIFLWSWNQNESWTKLKSWNQKLAQLNIWLLSA